MSVSRRSDSTLLGVYVESETKEQATKAPTQVQIPKEAEKDAARVERRERIRNHFGFFNNPLEKHHENLADFLKQ